MDDQLPVYCLSCDLAEKSIKKNHIQEQFNNVEFVYPIIGIAKNKSGASGFMRMVEKGLQLQEYGKPFSPFLMIEDDVSIYQPVHEITIPDNTDILYVGLSNCSMNDCMFHYANYYESLADYPEVIKIKHMLATHGILICSPLGASVIQRTMLEVFMTDVAWDVPLAFIQPYYNVYALKTPFVYQDSTYGGDEDCTKISLSGPDNILPQEWVTYDLCTIRMIYRN
jgi:hypothetical protein